MTPDRNFSRLHGDELTWALHAENREKFAVLFTYARIGTVALGIGITLLGYIAMKPG